MTVNPGTEMVDAGAVKPSQHFKAATSGRTRLPVLAFSLALIVGCVLASTVWSERSRTPDASRAVSGPPSVFAMTESWEELVAELQAVNRLQPQLIGAFGSDYGLETFAGEAAVAAYLVNGDSAAGTISLVGRPRMADRVAIGLEQMGVGFSRSVEPDRLGKYGTELALNPEHLGLLDTPAHSHAALARLATLVELDGSAEGRLARAHAAEVALQLATEIGVATVWNDGELWIADLGAISLLAQAHYVDPTHVPVLGLGFEYQDPQVAQQLGLNQDYWRTGVTGKLPESVAPEWEGLISPTETPIGWTNAVAQGYRTASVRFRTDGIQLFTRPASEPGVTRLPFTSGMIVSQDTFGWGKTTVSIELPDEAGLWPAVWLLDSQACFAPGICPGFQTDLYHEIDLIETRTQEPDVAHMSVHWAEEGRTVSNSATAVSSALAGPIDVELERRPGLLLWKLDGKVVHALGGYVTTFETGPHRNGDMRLIINTAVGGSFAGGDLIGRDGGWWGDTRAPEGFGTLDWSEAKFVVYSAVFDPLS